MILHIFSFTYKFQPLAYHHLVMGHQIINYCGLTYGSIDPEPFVLLLDVDGR